MKLSRLLLAVVGLVALVAAYLTGSVLFLAIAVIAFISGLYLMGANKKPAQKDEESAKNKSSRK